MANGWLKIILEDKAIDPITLTFLAIALIKVGKDAHDKSRARQSDYAQAVLQAQKDMGASQAELEAKRKKALQSAAIQAAYTIREQRLKEAEAKVKQEQQKQILIVAGLGLAATGLIVYTIKHK